jgi:hypothetical protein
MNRTVCLALAVLAAGAAKTASGTATAPAATIVGVAGRAASDLVLVGSAGEIYRLDAKAQTPTWRRAGGGGTAATLATARGAAASDIWAMGASAPPYRFDGTTWSAPAFPMSGAGVMSRSGAPAVAVARRVMVHSGGKWVQLPSTGVLGAAAVWAAGPRDAVVATSAGDLERYDGTTWKAITPAFAQSTERVESLWSAPSGGVIAVGDQGSMILLDKTSSKAIGLDARMTSFSARVGAQASNGKASFVGTATIGGKARLSLVTLDGGKLVLQGDLPAVGGDVPVAMIIAADGGIVVATRGGIVLVRAAGQTTWTRGVVDATLDEGDHPTNPPATSGATP